jgi:(1->4)-alpha-D-glucan 1-alpha-D-glucosylmutase
MAKGFEDTTCYVYNRLLSQNEVGGDPELSDPPVDSDSFHRRNCERLQHWPHSLNATSTHDTKRSEDVRARINVLTEIPREWSDAVERWALHNERYKSDGAPDRNDEYMFYQTLVGAWPLCEEDVPTLRDRLRNFAQKASREAKVHSTWLNPNESYENAFFKFIEGALDSEEFTRDFTAFHERIAHRGAVNALAQVLLKICSPGVPDFYQGTELWDFSLVDPDNRRPVDFKKRTVLLDDLRRAEAHDLPALIKDLTANWRDGRIKLYVTYKTLTFRRANAELFQTGDYIPAGGRSFARRLGDRWTLAVAGDLGLPEGAPTRWRNLFTGEEGPAADLLTNFPVGLLEGGL